MTRYATHLLATFALVFVVMSAAFYCGRAAFADPGPGSGAIVSPTPADHLHDPLTSPGEAWADEKIAWTTSWVTGIFAALVLVTKGLGTARTTLRGWPVLGGIAVWLAIGKRAVIVAGVGTVAATAYNALVSGGSWAAAVIAAIVAGVGLLHPYVDPSQATASASTTAPP